VEINKRRRVQAHILGERGQEPESIRNQQGRKGEDSHPERGAKNLSQQGSTRDKGCRLTA